MGTWRGWMHPFLEPEGSRLRTAARSPARSATSGEHRVAERHPAARAALTTVWRAQSDSRLLGGALDA